jgi:hypothetical protein
MTFSSLVAFTVWHVSQDYIWLLKKQVFIQILQVQITLSAHPVLVAFYESIFSLIAILLVTMTTVYVISLKLMTENENRVQMKNFSMRSQIE